MKTILSLIILFWSSGSTALVVGEDLPTTSTIRAADERCCGFFQIPLSQDEMGEECSSDGCGCELHNDILDAAIIADAAGTFLKAAFYESDSSPLIHPNHSVFRPPVTI